MKRSSLGILVLALAASFGAVAQDGTLGKIKSSGTITVGHRDVSDPFSYLDDKQQPVGYAMDLCARIVDAVKAELKMPNLKVNYQLVTSANRIQLLANGTIDMECGSTTNNAARQEQVWFAITHFLTPNRWAARKSSNIKSINDLKGKTVVFTAGTTNIKQITELNAAKNLGMNIISANGHAEAFQMVATGRAVAFAMDDVLLAGLIAKSGNPADFEITAEPISLPEPYGIMVRKDDKPFKALADRVISDIYKSGQINAIYEKWFQKPIPPKSINFNLPMSAAFKKVVGKPTDSGDPKDYE